MTAINFFIDHRGKSPVSDFLDKNKSTKVKAFIIFSNIQEFGISSAIPHIKKLNGLPLWEIRILGKDSVRILYAHQQEDSITLLHAFKKKTNKTPVKEINIAISRLNRSLHN